MARQIVTQQAVDQAAEALSSEGQEPSIVAVQSRIGAGSYSTVKRYLDVWKQSRADAAMTSPEMPAEVQSKGHEFARAVWALASREAQVETQQVRDEACAEVATVRAELTQANNEIARLETVEGEQAAKLEQQQARLRDTELALAAAQTLAHRVPELEKALAEIRGEVDAARKEATQKAVEAGRLAGEAEALRAQVQQLMAAIKPNDT